MGEERGVALKANLKETQNSPAGLWETSAKVFYYVILALKWN